MKATRRLRVFWWTPPPVVFPIVWTILYILIAVSLWRLWERAPVSRRGGLAVLLFFAQLILNAIWTPVFFGLHTTQVALAIIEVARHNHIDQDTLRATSALSQMRHPARLQRDDIARLCPGREVHFLFAVESGDGNVGSQGGLHHSEVLPVEDVIALTFEEGVRRHPDLHVHITGQPPTLPGATTAAQAHTLTVGDTRRDVNR